ncbi:hypothetical protein F750_1896 [Streptomyces sp. PAMC 26508]|nr:hypothetical protein F750_1896 [Streptomyces sp. PAMC 26508]
MAGGARLVDLHQDGVGVAVERDRPDLLGVPGGVALDPVLLAAAGPVGAAARGEGAVQRLVVHPAEHEDLARVVLLGDGREESVGAALDAGGDGRVETAGGRGAGRAGHAPIVPRRARLPGRASTGRTAGGGRTLAGMSTHAKRERLLLADLLEAAGPEAQTLCNGWKTRDLAAHVVVRERRADAAGGILLGVLKNRLERVQAEFAAKPYEELIQLIRTGPPRMSPFGLKQLDEAANTVEFYIHAEDVRRAQPDWSQRDLDPVFADVLWSRTEKTARMMGRRSPVGLVLRRPDGQTAVAHKGAPVVTVTGEPGELLLFAAGRQDAARVELDGDKDALARLHTAELGL